ncbi:MAG: hypothetical protein ACE5DT_05545 [Nitrosopumilus sp.]
MTDSAHAWRKKLRLQELVDIAKEELESGKEISQIYEMLDDIMQERWRFVNSTKRQYLDDVKKILTNQYVLVI